jgi:hypothetical protein
MVDLFRPGYDPTRSWRDLKSNHAPEGRSTHNVISADIVFLDDSPGHVCVRFLFAILKLPAASSRESRFSR